MGAHLDTVPSRSSPGKAVDWGSNMMSIRCTRIVPAIGVAVVEGASEGIGR